MWSTDSIQTVDIVKERVYDVSIVQFFKNETSLYGFLILESFSLS